MNKVAHPQSGIVGASSPSNAKSVMLGGVQTLLEGAADDPYFDALEHHAAALDGLAALVARHVLRSSTIIDVGANIGLSTILLARLARRVVAYEPSPPNVALLRRNLALNGITNVEVRAAAASSEPGTLVPCRAIRRGVPHCHIRPRLGRHHRGCRCAGGDPGRRGPSHNRVHQDRRRGTRA